MRRPLARSFGLYHISVDTPIIANASTIAVMHSPGGSTQRTHRSVIRIVGWREA